MLSPYLIFYGALGMGVAEGKGDLSRGKEPLRGQGSRKVDFLLHFPKVLSFLIECHLVYSKICKTVDLAVKNVKRLPMASPLPSNFKRVFPEYFFVIIFS